MSLRRFLAAAVALCLSLPALAANEKGFVQVAGIGGPGLGGSRPGWLDMPSSDITFEATPDMQCSAVLDIDARHVAPVLAGMVGTTVDEITVELTDFHGHAYYEARLTDSFVRKVVTSSDEGLHVEAMHVEPASIRLEVRRREPNGQLGSPAVRVVACGPTRS